jgi:hypothetical protein
MNPLTQYRWAFELAAAIVLIAGMWLWHHETFEAGIAKQRAADAAASQILIAKAAAETADWRLKANNAEHAYNDESQALQVYRDTHVASVRLCVSPSGSDGVQNAAGKVAGTPAASPAAAGVQPVPPGDFGSGGGQAGVDIGPMLTALAARADQVSAKLREAQAVAP